MSYFYRSEAFFKKYFYQKQGKFSIKSVRRAVMGEKLSYFKDSDKKTNQKKQTLQKIPIYSCRNLILKNQPLNTKKQAVRNSR